MMKEGKSKVVLELVDALPNLKEFIQKEIETHNLPLSLNRLEVNIMSDDGISIENKTKQYISISENLKELKTFMKKSKVV